MLQARLRLPRESTLHSPHRAIGQECTRIAPMDKEELKERIRVPLLGFSAVLMSIVAFLLFLYAITVVIRFFFALGSLG